jgi:hypothetical protein
MMCGVDAWQGLEPGTEFVLRYLYDDGSVGAVLPMHVVSDAPELMVGWLAPLTPIMYWSTQDGRDPREEPLDQRFIRSLSTAPRIWQGPGVLRVMPAGLPYQVVHFWGPDGAFAGWYVNFERPRARRGLFIDSVDWHVDLWIGADRVPTWKDEDEAAAAVAAGRLSAADLHTARTAGESIIDDLATWPQPIGDWRSFHPDPTWRTPGLPSDWTSGDQ